MGKFKPVKFAFTIFGISIITLVILFQLTSDEGLGVIIPAPELRVVGGCFKDCLDPDQTGFGTLDCPDGLIAQEGVCVESLTGTLTTETTTESNGEIVVTIETTVITVQADGTIGSEDTPATTSTTTTTKETATINEQEFEVLQVTNPIACWVSVDADIIGAKGLVIDTEKSAIFKFAPVAQLSLVDLPSGFPVLDQGGFDIKLKIQCSTNTESGGLDPEGDLFNYFNVFNLPSFDTPLRLEATKLTARVWSENSEGFLIDTFNFPLDVDGFDIFGAQLLEIGSLKIPYERILIYLENGKYTSTQNIVLDGNLVLHWDTGIADVDKFRYVIPLLTNISGTTEGLTTISNPVKITRDVLVDKDVSGETPKMLECDNDETVVGEICVKTDPNGCEPNEVKKGLLCVEIGEEDTINPTVPEIFTKLSTCLTSGDPNCLASAEFLPFWIFGIGLVVALGAVAQRRQPDIYGVPRGGF